MLCDQKLCEYLMSLTTKQYLYSAKIVIDTTLYQHQVIDKLYCDIITDIAYVCVSHLSL